jgi:hypothetical protein
MPQDKLNVRDNKGDAEKPQTEPNKQEAIVQGNIPVLTVRLLNSINQNLVAIAQQNAKILEIFKHVEASKDG